MTAAPSVAGRATSTTTEAAMLELCALIVLTIACPHPDAAPPPALGLLDRIAAARAADPSVTPFPLDDEPADPVRADAPSAQPEDGRGVDDDPAPMTTEPDEPASEPVVEPEVEPRYGVGEPWATLAECESGDWIDGGESFVEGSARWAWGGADPIPPWGTSIHDGGLQHHPDTWDWVAPDVLDDPPARAYDATPEQQVAVATEVQRRQGWEAWPVCSRKIGLR